MEEDWTFHGYTTGPVIGGGIGSLGVNLAYHEDRPGETFVMKTLAWAGGQLPREAAIYAPLNHPHIIALKEWFRTPGRVHMIFEHASGVDLQALLRKGPIEIGLAMNLVRQCIQAVEYLHCLGISHGDLKPANFVLDGYWRVKLVDFGEAKYGPTSEGFHGTRGFAAPEVWTGGPHDAFAADVWSLGVTCVTVLRGRPPFRDLNARGQSLTLPEEWPTELKELLEWMVKEKAEERPQVWELREKAGYSVGLQEPYRSWYTAPDGLQSASAEPREGETDPELAAVLAAIGARESELQEQGPNAVKALAESWEEKRKEEQTEEPLETFRFPANTALDVAVAVVQQLQAKERPFEHPTDEVLEVEEAKAKLHFECLDDGVVKAELLVAGGLLGTELAARIRAVVEKFSRNQ
jgi:serine/threonine protein kinase